MPCCPRERVPRGATQEGGVATGSRPSARSPAPSREGALVGHMALLPTQTPGGTPFPALSSGP